MKRHLSALDQIAKRPENRNSRSVTNGYNASANYVISELQKDATCVITHQSFEVPIWTEHAPPQLMQTKPNEISYQFAADFVTPRFGGNFSGEASGVIFAPAEDGCSLSGYDSKPDEAFVALLPYYASGSCVQSLTQRALIAQQAGASALLISFNPTDPSELPNPRLRLNDWTPSSPLVQLPVLITTHALGSFLLPGVEVKVTTDTSIEIVETFNVICDDPNHNSKKQTIIVGAHLDSVPEGPGINDNGSGSSALLEIAKKFYKHKSSLGRLENNVRYIWWGAEELGLMGSRFYVNDLVQNNQDEWKRIACNLNFDMVTRIVSIIF